MPDDLSRTAPQPAADPWRHLESLVDQIAELTLRRGTRLELAAAVLEKLVDGLPATAGAIWSRDEPGNFDLDAERNLVAARIETAWRDPRSRTAAFEQALAGGQSLVLAPTGAQTGPRDVPGPTTVNPTPFWLLVGPVLLGEQPLGVVELYLPGDLPSAVAASARQFLSVVVEILSDYHQRLRWSETARRQKQIEQSEQFAAQLALQWRLQAIADVAAQDGRLLAGCDRLSLLVCDAAGVRLLATSGVDLVDRRAAAVRVLEQLTAAVVATGEDWRFPAPEAIAAPQFEAPLAAWLEESSARAIAICPLVEPADAQRPGLRPWVLGALVAEWFQAGGEAGKAELLAALKPPVQAALARARVCDRWPQRWWIQSAAARPGWHWARRRTWFLVAAGALLAATLLAALTPAEFNVHSPGQLQPTLRRHSFAPADAVVGEVRAAHGQAVAEGETLLVLRRPELDQAWTQLLGELETIRVQLAATNVQRFDDPPAQGDGSRNARLAADAEQLKQRLTYLEREQEILKTEIDRLQIRSPLAGTVLTWGMEELLAGRPVRRGQVLVTVANLAGAWELELQIPDEQVRHVAFQLQTSGEPLPVQFLLATAPEVRHSGQLVELGQTTEVDQQQGSRVRARVTIDPSSVSPLRAGAAVSARIDCGTRSVAYVWLNPLWEALLRLWW